MHQPRIPCKSRVHRDQHCPLDLGLSEQQTVEQVFVQWRPAPDCKHMFTIDFKLAVAGIEQASSKAARIDAEVRAPETCFDHDLPQGYNTEQQRVVRVLNQRAQAWKGAPAPRLPKAATACPGAVGSCLTHEHPFDFSFAHPIEVVRHGELTDQEAKPRMIEHIRLAGQCIRSILCRDPR